jgi:NDP-sugar pyrophosphorylase family protein
MANLSRVTITIKKDLLKKLDDFVDGTQIKNRSHAIEFLLGQSFSSCPKTAVILAGGKGIKSGKETISRTLVKDGKKMFIENILLWLGKNRINNIIISAGDFSDSMKKILGDGTAYNVKISYLLNDTGTADVLRKLKGKINETFLLTNGNVFSEIDLNEMFEFHKKSNAVCTIAVISAKEPANFGNVTLQGDKVVDFVEKPKLGKEKSYLINAGIYIMEPDIFNKVSSKHKSLEKDLFPLLAKKGELGGYNIHSEWISVDNI